MRLMNNRLLLTAIEQKQAWEGLKDDSIKLGKVAFPFTGTGDEKDISFKDGDVVYYQYGTNVYIDGTDYILIRVGDIVCQK